jgi:mono/diheme cytochrome c family protein
MSEHLAAAAKALSAPEAVVRRSAEARAKATGTAVEAVLAAWAGGGRLPAAAPDPPPTQQEPPRATIATPPPAPPELAAPAPGPAPVPAAAAPATEAIPGPVAPPPPPAAVGPEQAIDHPVVVSVRSAGILERTVSAIPRWMAATFLVLPAFGLLYLAGDGGAVQCTEGGVVLAADRVTGLPENCDGSPFEGRGTAGGGGAQFLARGAELYATCAGCHGAGGGGGVGPALNTVLVDFGACGTQIEWVTLGSAGWPGSTYGDLAKPKRGGMPGFGSSLTPEEIASVVTYERVTFGGGGLDEVVVDCGLVAAEEAGEGTPTETAPTEATPTG